MAPSPPPLRHCPGPPLGVGAPRPPPETSPTNCLTMDLRLVCWNPVCSGLRRHERRRREHGHRSTRSKRPLLGPRVKPVHGKDSQENSHETQSASRFAKAEHVRPAMSITKNKKKHPHLSRFGFSFERGGVHTSRTMMLEELVGLLACVHRPEAERSDYLQAIDHDLTHL